MRKFIKLGKLIDKQATKNICKLVDEFLGIGICKNCGYEHPSIIRYCEDCQERSIKHQVKLFMFSSNTFQIRKKEDYNANTNKDKNFLVQQM